MIEASQDDDESMGDAVPPTARRDPYRVLRDGNFTRFLTAALLLRIGAQMQTIAVGWEIYERTRSALALGMVGLAQVAPVLLLAIPSGHLSDRHDRKMLFVGSNVLMLIGAVGLAVVSASQAPVDWIYVFLVVTGIGQALNRPTRWAIQPMLVPRDSAALGDHLEREHRPDRLDGRPGTWRIRHRNDR